MTRTVFSTMTDRASLHLDAAHTALTASEGPGPSQRRPEVLATRVTEHRDLTDALAHLGRTVRGRVDARRDTATDRLLATLEQRARARAWAEAELTGDPVVSNVREASRCVRAAADLWATHRTRDGLPRSPEASQLRHPSMQGAAVRHWKALITQSASLATELVRIAGSDHRDLVGDLRRYPHPTRSTSELRPVPLPLARSGAVDPPNIFDAVDDRIDRIHRHVWELSEDKRMSSVVLINVAAIGMLLARAALQAEQRSGTSGPADSVARCAQASAAQSDTHSDLELWATAAAALTPIRTPDAPATVLQVERLDLARLLERALAQRGKGDGSTPPAIELAARRLGKASLDYRLVATPCASSIRTLHEQGLLYLAGRHLPRHLVSRHQSLVAARLHDRLVLAPANLARQLEAQLHAIRAAPTKAGSAA